MPRPSDEKLAGALRDAGLEDLALRAERGEFNDFFGAHAAPKMALVGALRDRETPAEAEHLAGRVLAGEFDSDRDEAAEWYASPEGQEMRDLMGRMS